MIDTSFLEAARDWAIAHESAMDRDIGKALADGHFSEPLPDGAIIGPTFSRGDPSGIILHRGESLLEWGPVDTPEMTFSVTKSYLGIVAGLAISDGLFTLEDRVGDTVPDLFESPQNRTITWAHLLHQTSEWEGTLWGKADRIDRNRTLGTAPGAPSLKGTHRDLHPPGTFWEYNDIRVNVLAYALMRAFREPLPEVLKTRIMDPIGASDSWAWHGYENSWVDIDGRSIQSVSGGAHWGGGLVISTRDHALVGQLIANRGIWDGQVVLPSSWIETCMTPCPIEPGYGCLWWLNPDGAWSKAAPDTSVFAVGVGRNIIWVDPALELVAVIRWLDRDSFDGFAERVLQAWKSA